LLQDQQRGWDHLEVISSFVYRLPRCLFGLRQASPKPHCTAISPIKGEPDEAMT
jgi:hypothetical protein